MININNYKFIYKNPHFYITYILLSIIVLLSFLFLFTYTYDKYITMSYITCTDKCLINSKIDSNINDFNYVIIDNKKYLINDIVYSEAYIDKEVMKLLQDIQIDVNLDESYNNKVEEIILLSNKQRMYKKIMNYFRR